MADYRELYVEVEGRQVKKHGEIVFGDVFMSRRIEKEDRTLIVLSDGLGSGIKANVLATLSASMALKFMESDVDIERTAETIMRTLPVCSVRKISYSTFTIIDIEHDGFTRIYEYDNPAAIILNGAAAADMPRSEIGFTPDGLSPRTLKYCAFHMQKEDRIILCSDGVTQAGMGSAEYPFGWGDEAVLGFVSGAVADRPGISAGEMAYKVVEASERINAYTPKDDSSCVCVYMREPRNLLICTGPPFEKENDAKLAAAVCGFNGRKIICGGTTALILSRETGREIHVDMSSAGIDTPPLSYMEGVDLVTEGILTLGRLCELLDGDSDAAGDADSPAGAVMAEIMNSDKIDFIVGTRINNAHQDPNLPVELEIRRNVVKRLAAIIEEKYLKKVRIRYI